MTNKMHLGLAMGLMAARIADPRMVAIRPEGEAPILGFDPVSEPFDEAPRRSQATRKDQQPGWNKPNILKKYRRKAQP